MAQVRSLAQELPYAVDETKKKKVDSWLSEAKEGRLGAEGDDC